ncbi:efflux RND transporter permease subunit [Longimicrobium sp.]|uniref:efflux RND transporter permease subunit n=1 Tax=Longimicrobium sp. TaxID=2029185 RepID=UPI002E373C50|nr:efflux RND transporter permease subunit [Longimicrobium sp.]HEX6041013.1 efflux RND transporter permease subunit [Longimicrobium sp.]
MIRFSIRRPVAVAMLYGALALLGVASWLSVPVELLPDTELPRLRITAVWPGASPEVTEAFLTSPIEAAVQQVRGVEKVTSTSEEERGVIEVEFGRDADLDFARLELGEQLAALDEQLPEGALRPVVEPYVPEEFQEQNQPFLRYTLTGPLTTEALRTVLDETVAPELRQVEGVADVQAFGGRDRVLEVALDERKILALGLTPDAVRQKVGQLEDVREAGRVRRGGMEYALAVREYAGSPDRIRQLPLLTDKGRVVRLQDVAVVRDTYEEPRRFYRIDGQPAVSFQVVREIGTNVVRVSDGVKARMAQVERSLPPGGRILLDADESEGVRTQLTDLRGRALSSALIVFAVLFFFLRSFRSAAIVFASIAFAALITLNLIYFGGLTLNVLTLMGLAMGFGLIIDNAVVVLENVYRHARTAPDAETAAERGAREMVLPVLAATLTTIIVFIPFVYLQGEVRLFYVPLAVVVGFTNLASLFVTFSFTPALAGRLLGSRVEKIRLQARRARPPWYERLYAGMVGGTLRWPWMAVIVSLLALGGSAHLFNKFVTRGTVWRPWYDQESYIQISFSLPRGEELERTDQLVRFFEQRLGQMPEVARFTTNVYAQAAQMKVEFPDSLQDTAVPVSIKEQMEAYSHQYGGAEVRVTGYGPSFYGGGGSPPNYSIQVLGYNYEKVREIADDLGRRLQQFSRIQDVDTNSDGAWYQRDKATEVVLRVDRPALAAHGISAREVVNRVGAAVGRNGSRGRLRVGDEEVAFSVALDGHRTMDVQQLRQLLIPGPGGGAVRLADVARVDEREVLSRIVREDQQYQRTVSYEFRGPTKLGDKVHEAVMKATRLPAGYTLVGREEWKWGDDEKAQIYGVLAVSLILVFMVTAALFESIRQPLCVLLTVPMALIGVFLVFFFTGASFSREAFIGVIMMGGVVTNNATLLVDHLNHVRREAGLSLRDAILRGTLERVRPILMTSAVTILGLLPLVVMSEAADANIWNALGYALLGGLGSSTILVLTVTPALYLLFERGPERRRLAREAAASTDQPISALEPAPA